MEAKLELVQEIYRQAAKTRQIKIYNLDGTQGYQGLEVEVNNQSYQIPINPNTRAIRHTIL